MESAGPKAPITPTVKNIPMKVGVNTISMPRNDLRKKNMTTAVVRATNIMAFSASAFIKSSISRRIKLSEAANLVFPFISTCATSS